MTRLTTPWASSYTRVCVAPLEDRADKRPKDIQDLQSDMILLSAYGPLGGGGGGGGGRRHNRGGGGGGGGRRHNRGGAGGN